jgi:hypothetical protein
MKSDEEEGSLVAGDGEEGDGERRGVCCPRDRERKRTRGKERARAWWHGAGGEGKGGQPRRAMRRREKERRGAALGQQPDRVVGMASGGTVEGGSVRSRWRRAGEQGKVEGARTTWRGSD